MKQLFLKIDGLGGADTTYLGFWLIKNPKSE